MKYLGKAGLGAAAVATVVLGIASIAFATTSGSVTLATTGVRFAGTYVFYPAGTNHGGMAYPGQICDTAADGNPVRVHARVEGYGYGPSTFDRRGSGYCTSEAQYVYDPAANYVTTGSIQACQDRGIFPDACKSSPTYTR